MALVVQVVFPLEPACRTCVCSMMVLVEMGDSDPSELGFDKIYDKITYFEVHKSLSEGLDESLIRQIMSDDYLERARLKDV